jgi:G3E family GTPase
MSFEQNLFAHYEATTIFRRDTNKKLPITLITGPLGSGKTTAGMRIGFQCGQCVIPRAVRNIVKNRANLRICVAVNDFAHVNVDQAVLCHGASSSSSTHDCSTTHSNGMSTKRVVDSVVSLHDGCICCSLMGQFRESIAKIIHSDDAFDYAIIETSGVTDPTTVIAALEEQFGKMYRARLDQVVCVIDASLFFIDDPHNSCCNDDNDSHCYTTTTSLSSHGAGTDCCQQREDNGRRHARLDRLTLAQLRSADLIVLNKTDLIDDKQLERAFAYIAEINPMAKVRPTTYAEIPIHELLDVVVAVNHGSSSGVLSHEAGNFFVILHIILHLCVDDVCYDDDDD